MISAMTKGKIVQVMGPVVDVEFKSKMCIRDRMQDARSVQTLHLHRMSGVTNVHNMPETATGD